MARVYRPKKPAPMSKDAAKRAADRAEARARGEDPVETPTPLEPFEVSPGAAPAFDDEEYGWAVREIDPSKGGRPTKYRPEYARIAKALVARGAFEREVADALGVSLRTIANWKYRYPKFGVSLQIGRDQYDEPVVHAIAKAAIGYEIETEKVFCHNGEIIRAKTREYVKPDVAAQKFWLINRQKKDWSDKITHGHTDNDGNDRDIYSLEAQTEFARRLAFVLTRAAQQPKTIALKATATDDERD